MAESLWPTPDNGSSVNDVQYESLMGSHVPSGVVGSPGSSSVIYTTGVGRTVAIRAGKYGIVGGRTWYSGSSVELVDLAANSSGSTRVDLVVLRLTRSTWNVRVAVVEGVPSGSPVAPSPTQTLGASGVFEVPLAQVEVPHGATSINAGQITSVETYVSRPQLVGVRAALPASGVYAGQQYACTDTLEVFWWTGSAWLHDRFMNGTIYAVRTTDQTLTGTTLVNDNTLAVSVQANTIWHVETELNYSATVAGDFKVAFSAPNYATLAWNLGGAASTVTEATGSAYWGVQDLAGYDTAGGGGTLVCRPSGTLVVGSNGGTFRVRVAQGTASGTTKILTGSLLKLTRLAT